MVVKPLDGNHGRGVSINLLTEEQVEVAHAEAYAQGKSSGVIVKASSPGSISNT